ncbi:hypothetical protein Lepto7375DRAFT_7573 [Leptolyngbya sp. PCC 7375]|nr:hypothetical protein Lepto7375DRAFT_7573 [Leptolyngbya sp. PCC 7375]
MINRSAVIIHPKQPYINWASQLDNSNITLDQNDEPTIYLIPEYKDDSSAWTILEQIYDSIFDAELHAWHTGTSDWPANRTFEMFRDWFDVVFVSAIAELSSGPILDDVTTHPID